MFDRSSGGLGLAPCLEVEPHLCRGGMMGGEHGCFIWPKEEANLFEVFLQKNALIKHGASTNVISGE